MRAARRVRKGACGKRPVATPLPRPQAYLTKAIKLSSVITDLHGVTGRDIMDHLIAGERDPKVLAQLARARARRKIAELEEALEGAEFFAAEHAALLAAMLARIDRVNAEIDELTAAIERLLAPYEEQLEQAESMPSWGRRSAQDAVAETGVDMTRFRTGGHLSSWAGKTPLDNQSGKRTGRAKSKKGNRYLAAVTGETAIAAGKTQTREGARYRRLARRRGKPKAQVAVGNTQLKVCHKLVSNPGMRYQDLGADYYERQRDDPPADRSPRRQARRARLRSDPVPHPRTRTRRNRGQPGRLTPAAPAGPGQPVTAKVRYRAPRLGLIFGSAPDTARAAPYRRENGFGTARDVVASLVRLRPRVSLTLGTGFSRGRSLSLLARGSVSSARPRLPGRYHLAG